MLEGFDLNAPNIMLSGGAEGADTAFSKAASSAGHQVVHWTFAGYKSKLKKGIYQLSEEHLIGSEHAVNRANKNLLRSYPSKNDHINNLLRRNYFQVRWSESVYAIGRLDDSNSMLKIAGGTAWACQMYVDRFIYDQEPMSLCKLYLFDMNTEKWYQWNKIWYDLAEQPPIPVGVYAGIGSRDISDTGKSAINNLYKA